jgi:hypothetical protein
LGNGTTTFNSSTVAQLVDPAGSPVTSIAANRQSVSAEYRSPLAIGFGASRAFGGTKLYLSTESFQSVGPYTILDAEPFQSPSSGETLSSDIVQQLDSVINVALGVEQELGHGRRVYGSFWTDFNAAPDDRTDYATGSPYDLYHVGGGYSFDVGGSYVTLGGVFAFGSAETNLGIGLAQEIEDVTVSYYRVTFILGFNFALAASP